MAKKTAAKGKAPAKGISVKAHSRSTRKSPVKAHVRGLPKGLAGKLPKGLGTGPAQAALGMLPKGLGTPNAQAALGAPPFSGVGGGPAMPTGRGLGRQQMFIPGA